jgi:16S rRNA (adenine1518-N6/adenine1519-N6)-dimethyltransferase
MPTKLGQNFLNDPAIVEKIVRLANISPDDFVLEVGPGNGILTEELLKQAKKIICVEVDKKLAPTLEEKFKNQTTFNLVVADILKTDLCSLTNNQPYRVIANIPYYITSKIIRLFLETPCQPKELILMIQKEVAERIVARPGEMSILSNSVQYYAQAEILFLVPREKFTPPPEVDSAVIKITPKTNFDPNNPENKAFFKLVRAGFSAKRKTLLNNLSNSLRLDKQSIETTLLSLNLKATVRAQELSVENWKELQNKFNLLF